MHAHDDHFAGVVTNHKVLRVLGKRNHTVDGDLRRPGQRLERVDAFAGLCVPDLEKIHSQMSVAHHSTFVTLMQHRP